MNIIMHAKQFNMECQVSHVTTIISNGPMGQIMHTGWITSGPGQGLTPYPIRPYLHGYSFLWGSGK